MRRHGKMQSTLCVLQFAFKLENPLLLQKPLSLLRLPQLLICLIGPASAALKNLVQLIRHLVDLLIRLGQNVLLWRVGRDLLSDLGHGFGQVQLEQLSQTLVPTAKQRNKNIPLL